MNDDDCPKCDQMVFVTSFMAGFIGGLCLLLAILYVLSD